MLFDTSRLKHSTLHSKITSRLFLDLRGRMGMLGSYWGTSHQVQQLEPLVVGNPSIQSILGPRSFYGDRADPPSYTRSVCLLDGLCQDQTECRLEERCKRRSKAIHGNDRCLVCLFPFPPRLVSDIACSGMY
jgi:hypothetical protein